ncbi:MAG: DNA/RNA non-specific endonuclease [Sulfuricurvum sp.]|uniref:DNA/RNA non-specific endonuclease n=1 Tax=Sulfuricurvum sp. TaxID=2025608 RepID=UPI002637B2A7|nr:DNA/RNA non-specific endonuclease [Sulfuricurvum sp.]MDD2830217.1 DNA/RNA non-specific endonuclease [Sulfuricurvum sp.]MDD4950013.1 DNA/RNA non-specific endonuclease [Sulfuricurvum sp.]
MKLFLTLISPILLSSLLFSAPTQCDGLYYGNEAPEILNTKLQPKTQELCYSSFALMHSGISRTPLWSAEHLTKEGLRHKSKRSNDFHPDDQLNADDRAELIDYARSGYDRGHLAPAADMGNKQAQHECFTLANMVPQNSENNRGIWSAIEGATRHLTNQKGELYVITGPIFSGSQVKKIGGRVLVPSKLYKAIYDPSSNQGGAYLVSNAVSNDFEVVSIAEIEQMSGIKLFPKMSQSAKKSAMDLPDPQDRNGGSYNNLSNKDIIYLIEKLLKWIF